MKERGFTIAEALIVLAIIAILSYLLFPLFLKVKRQVQIYSSVSKLRQIHLAIENYRQAWDGADVFTSYRSYHKLGLPDWQQHGPGGRGCLNPWEYTDTSHRDWWSPCATGIYEYDREFMFWAPLPCAPPGYIGVTTMLYRPSALEPRIPGVSNWVLYTDYIPRYRQNIVVAIDPYCNPPGTPLGAPFLYKRGLSLLLSGQVVHKYAPGSAINLQWWSDPPED